MTGFKTSSFTLFFKFGGNQSKPEFAVDLRGSSVEWASKEKSSKKHVIEVRVSWLNFLKYSFLETLKGIVHPRIKILSSFIHTQIWVSFFCWTQKKVFWRMLVTKQLIVAIDFYSILSILWKSMATINCLVTNLLQNIFFCAQQKKETQVWNTLRVSKWWQNCNFWVKQLIMTIIR